jgi:tRNA A-37 threonylcarbamoyl transferase component Bud32
LSFFGQPTILEDMSQSHSTGDPAASGPGESNANGAKKPQGAAANGNSPAAGGKVGSGNTADGNAAGANPAAEDLSGTVAHTIPANLGRGTSETKKANVLDLDLSGRQLGDYRLLRRLGRGAMADVYLAEQGSLRRQVAFKVLKRELAADDTYVRRFHMEAQAAAALVQANIVQIYEVGDIAGWHYIAQEYVEGQNVAQYLARHGSVEVKLALAVMRQVVAALCKAAERGIVHRDIKPENIMLAKSGEVKVADFGLARIGAADDNL